MGILHLNAIDMTKQQASRSIVITGMGWVTPLGHDLESVWPKLLAGQSAVKPTFHFDASTFPTSFSAQVSDYDYQQYVQQHDAHEGVGRNTAYALGAAAQAFARSGLGAGIELNYCGFLRREEFRARSIRKNWCPGTA